MPSSSSTELLTVGSNGTTTTGTSPTKKRSASADSLSSATPSAERTAGPSLTNTTRSSSTDDHRGSTASLLWSRRESAPNLADISCRIHATPNAGCRNCRGDPVMPSTSTSRRRCSVAISNGTSKQQPTGRSSVPTGASRCNAPPLAQGAGNNQGGLDIGVPGRGGNASGGSNGGESSKSDAVDMDDGTYIGPGKRVWEKVGSGASTTGSGLSTPLSGSTPATSFYFPSAAASATSVPSASATAVGNGGGATPCRPNARRRISTDSIPACIKDEYSNGTGRRDGTPSFTGGGGTRFGGNSGGGGGGARRNSPPLINLDPDSIGARSGGFAGMGSARSLPIKQDRSSNGDGAGNEGARLRSGDDLEKLVVSVATKGMQQALQYGLRNTFFMLLRKKVRSITPYLRTGMCFSTRCFHLVMALSWGSKILAQNVRHRGHRKGLFLLSEAVAARGSVRNRAFYFSYYLTATVGVFPPKMAVLNSTTATVKHDAHLLIGPPALRLAF